MIGTALRRHPVLVLALAFLVLGSIYSLVTPVFEAPDEVFHFAFVRYVATQAALPIQGAHRGEETAEQEASQPPLYYVLAAPLVSWINSNDFSRVGQLNPHAAPGLPHNDGNKNMVVPVPAPFPWSGTILAMHVLRFFSLLLGLVTVLATYAIARRLWYVASARSPLPPAPRNTIVLSLLTASLVAFNPQFLFISASINNDNIMTALASLALAAVVYFATDDEANPINDRRAALLGVLGGLAVLSKLTGLLLLGFILTAMTVTEIRSFYQHRVRPVRSFLRDLAGHLAITLAVATAVAGWWYARNLMLYGDVTGLQPMLSWVGQHNLSLQQLIGQLQGLELSFWAVFGWFNILADDAVYTVLQIVLRLALLGLIMLGLRRWCASGAHGVNSYVLALCAIWAAIVIAGLARWTATTPGTQGRLLFPAISSIVALLACGLAGLAPVRARASVLAAFAGALFVLSVIAPFRYIAPAYARPPILTSDPPSVQHPAGLTYGANEIQLLGYSLNSERIAPGGQLTVTVYIEAQRPISRDYSLFIHLWGRNMQWLGQRDSYPGRGSLPTSQMIPGEIIADRYLVTIPPTATVPSRAQIEIGFYDFNTRQRLPAATPQSAPIQATMVGQLKLAAANQPTPAMQRPLFSLGAQANLVAANVAAPALIRPGSVITVSSTWQATSAMTQDYTIFLQLVDQASGLITQHDGQPQAGEYPTSLWDVGECVTDVRTLALPANVAPGHYRIATGLYVLATGERLPVSGPGGPMAEKWAVIGEIDVK